MLLKIYDPNQVAFSVGGFTLSGFADGSMITVRQKSPAFASVVGSDGEVARSKSNDRRLEIVCKLIQTSASNAYLSGLHTTDINSDNGAGVTSVNLVDLGGGTIVQGSQAWVVQYPDDDFDRTATSREWTIEVANGVRAELGN